MPHYTRGNVKLAGHMSPGGWYEHKHVNVNVMPHYTRGNVKLAGHMSPGGGYEPEAHYSQWKRINSSIERRHVFHESLIKLNEGKTNC